MMRSALPICACTAAVRISSTVSDGKMLAIWNARTTPRRTIWVGERPPMSSPASFTRPRSGRIAPEIRLKNVVLPAPFGPMIAVSEPAGKSSVTFCIAATPPKDFERSSTCNMVVTSAPAVGRS